MDVTSKLIVAEDALQRLARLGCEDARRLAREALERIGKVPEAAALASPEMSLESPDAPAGVELGSG